MGLRHVVMFRWSDASTAAQQDAAVTALSRFAADVADLGRVRVDTDAGLAEGNASVVVTADFEDADGYRAYASDERHLRLVSEVIRPLLGERVALQHRT